MGDSGKKKYRPLIGQISTKRSKEEVTMANLNVENQEQADFNMFKKNQQYLNLQRDIEDSKSSPGKYMAATGGFISPKYSEFNLQVNGRTMDNFYKTEGLKSSTKKSKRHFKP